METETVVMSCRRRMVLKPLSLPAKSQNKEQNTTNDSSDRLQVQPPATTLLSPNSEKKKILLQDYPVPIITQSAQRNKVFLSYSADENNLTDTDDSDLDDDSTINTPNTSAKIPQESNKKIYYWIVIFLCWAAVQYWMIAVAGFGAVFFAISALVAICLNTTKTDKKRKNTLSAYSVFNPQCTPIQGSADPKQLERELVFGGL